MAGAVIPKIEQVLEKLLRSFVIIVPPFQSDVIHSVVLFVTCNTDFKILSLNVRGIRFFEKRKAIFNSITNGKEIRYYLFARDLRYSRSWELWNYYVFFSPESEHSRGKMNSCEGQVRLWGQRMLKRWTGEVCFVNGFKSVLFLKKFKDNSMN